MSDINWFNYTSISNSNSSLTLLKANRDKFLTQHVQTATRARGADTPHILDLVLSNYPFITQINHLAPLGHSDHACLEIMCDFEPDNIVQLNRFNYSKGEYNSLRNFLNVDWNFVLNPQSNNCETMWQLLRDKLIEGEKLYIPYFNNLKPYNNKWTRPLSKDLRNKNKK